MYRSNYLDVYPNTHLTLLGIAEWLNSTKCALFADFKIKNVLSITQISQMWPNSEIWYSAHNDFYLNSFEGIVLRSDHVISINNFIFI